jgi:hypothetical protein
MWNALLICAWLTDLSLNQPFKEPPETQGVMINIPTFADAAKTVACSFVVAHY